MSEGKGYWVSVSPTHIGRQHFVGQSLDELPLEWLIRIRGSDCPVEGLGKTQENARKAFIENFQFYKRTGPGFLPQLHSFQDYCSNGIANARYDFITLEQLQG